VSHLASRAENQLDSGTEGVSFRHCGADGQLDSGAEVQLDFRQHSKGSVR
jgi:hypothetical protein